MKVAAMFDMQQLGELFRSCTGRVQDRGRMLVQREGVSSLWLTEDWMRAGALVVTNPTGTQRVAVSLSLMEGTWRGVCTCAVGVRCEHIAAVTWSLLKTKGGIIDDVEVVDEVPRELWEEMVIRLNRPLTPTENRLASALTEIFDNIRYSAFVRPEWFRLINSKWPVFTILEMRTLKANMGTHVWQFWENLALLLSSRSIALPKPLDEITDLEAAKRHQLEEERRRQAEEWRRRIRFFPDHIKKSQSKPAIDLRIAIVNFRPVLEWKDGTADRYREMTQKQYGIMDREDLRGELKLTPEGSFLWSAWRKIEGTRSSYRMKSDPLPILHELFALPLLREKLVTSTGEPFRREGRRVRWTGEPMEDGGYYLRLVTDEGPVEESLLALPGSPWFYLSRDELLTGPGWWESGIYDPAASELVIPGDVIESVDGIQFLHTIDAPLPPKIQEEVEILPLQLRFICGLKRGNRSRSEEIEFVVEARGGGQLERFGKDGWYRLDYPSDDRLVVLTREQCDLMPGLWGDLPVKWDNYADIWRMRLTKNGPARFAEWARSLPPEVEVLAEGELATLLREPVSATATLECESAGVDWFDLKVVLNPSETDLTEAEMKELLNARGSYVRIAGKGWRRLELALSDEDAEQIAKIGVDARDFSAEPQRLHVLQLANPAARQLLPEEQGTEIVRRAGELKTRVTPSIPAAIHASLRPYQVDGYHFLAYLTENRFGGILADDMGLGKTLQALVWLAWLREREGATLKEEERLPPSLVVCPKSVMDNWRLEAERFLPSVKLTVWQGTDDKAFEGACGDADLMVINYSQMRGLAKPLEKVDWLAAILDEGQYIKNPGSQTAQTARKLRARQRLVLTGTPIENRLLDLWSLMAFAMPGILGPRAQFLKRFNEKQDPLARVRLSARVRPFLLRRTKQQVAPDLPDRVEEDLFCDLEGTQQTLYQAELKKAQAILLKLNTKKDLEKNRFNFLTSLTRLRQICCHPHLVAPKARSVSAKLDALMELLEPLMDEGQKVLIFSQFVSMLEIIREEVIARKWQHFLLTGQTENRGALVEEFQRSRDGSLFLISLKAGGSGLNLTAASYVVLFDPWWNPAVENQAIDRTHRIGQTSKVIAYRLVARGTIEQKIRDLQQQKSILAQDILGEEKFAASLTLDDFKFLLEE